MKLRLIMAALVLLSSSAAAAEFQVKKKCASDEQPLFSMYSKNGGNAGMPGYYKWQVCAEGVSSSGFYQSCPRDMNNVLSFYKKNDSHVSTFKSYKWKLCAKDIQSSINNSCSSSKTIASLHSKDDTHVAEPGYYKYQLCGSVEEPENITVEMSLDSSTFYVDGEKAEEKSYGPLEVAFPYIVSDQPLGLVSYGEFLSLSYDKRSGYDKVSLTQSSGSFLIPNTVGGYQEVEDEESEVLEGEFLSKREPSFGFLIPEEPALKISFDPVIHVKGFDRSLKRDIELYVRNTYGNQTEVRLRPGE